MNHDQQIGRRAQVKKQNGSEGRHNRGNQVTMQSSPPSPKASSMAGANEAGSVQGQGGSSQTESRPVATLDPPMARLFIACDLPPEIAQQIGSFSHKLHQELSQTGMKVRWVLPQSIHLTLRFIGETDPVIVPALLDALRKRVGEIKPFKASVAGAGAFPGIRNPRVIWVGTDNGSQEKMEALHRAVEDAVTSLGFPGEERQFTSHITLGRVVNSAGFSGLGDVLRNMKSAVSGGFDVDRIVLYKSELQASGPQYAALGYALLGQGGGDEY